MLPYHLRYPQETSLIAIIGIIFLALKIWEIDLLVGFQTCSICKTAELEIPISFFFFFFCASVAKYILNCHRKKYQLYFNLT